MSLSLGRLPGVGHKRPRSRPQVAALGGDGLQGAEQVDNNPKPGPRINVGG